jgi:hypothetical protein
MSRINQVGSHKTSIYVDSDGFTKVIYHNTPVVSFNDKFIILNTGGYNTNTTKLRMNQSSNQFRLGYQVYQKSHKWYIQFENNLEPIRYFADSILIDRSMGECVASEGGIASYLLGSVN